MHTRRSLRKCGAASFGHPTCAHSPDRSQKLGELDAALADDAVLGVHVVINAQNEVKGLVVEALAAFRGGLYAVCGLVEHTESLHAELDGAVHLLVDHVQRIQTDADELVALVVVIYPSVVRKFGKRSRTSVKSCATFVLLMRLMISMRA